MKRMLQKMVQSLTRDDRLTGGFSSWALSVHGVVHGTVQRWTQNHYYCQQEQTQIMQ